MSQKARNALLGALALLGGILFYDLVAMLFGK